MIRWLDIRRWPPVLRVLLIAALLAVFLIPEYEEIIQKQFTEDEVSLITLIILCFAIGFFFIYLRIRGVSQHYAGALFGLDEEQSRLFTQAVMNRIYPSQMGYFILQVKDGKLNPESPEIVKKIGGPGFVSIDSNHIVVTSRFGLLYRSLGVGFQELHPFEKVWDVIDLRPQYREITANFMTADGIPAKCKGNITFRVAPPWHENAFRLSTGKFIKSASGRNRISDWTHGIAGGAFDGAIRDTLERYNMDQLINPLGLHSPNRVPFLSTVTLTELEDLIREGVVETGKERGIEITHIELSEIRPNEAVLRAWQELWEAKILQMPRMQIAEQHAIQSQKALNAYVDKQVRLMQILGERANKLTQQGKDVLSIMIRTGVLDTVLNLDEDSSRVKTAILDKYDR